MENHKLQSIRRKLEAAKRQKLISESKKSQKDLKMNKNRRKKIENPKVKENMDPKVENNNGKRKLKEMRSKKELNTEKQDNRRIIKVKRRFNSDHQILDLNEELNRLSIQFECQLRIA